jgi:hypothetical protein
MNAGNVLQISERLPTGRDHIALRTLLKYMSGILAIPYKKTVDGTGIAESAVKNYVNDKSMRSQASHTLYAALVPRCAALIVEGKNKHQLDEYIVSVLAHLCGVDWLAGADLSLPEARVVRTALDQNLSDWLDVKEDRISQIESRFCGLWRILRFSSPPAENKPVQQSGEGQTRDTREVNYSLLNIRPRSVKSGSLCDFRWYYLGRGREQDEHTVFEGYVVPNADRIDFIGRAETGHRMVSLMAWRFTPNSEVRSHAQVANGIALAANTSNLPLAARVRAFLVQGSEALTELAFDELKDREMTNLGVHDFDSLRMQIPTEQYDKTLRYLGENTPIVGFFEGLRDTGDG